MATKHEQNLTIPQLYLEWQKTAGSLAQRGTNLSNHIKEVEIGLEMNTLSTQRLREIFKYLLTIKDKKISIEEIDVFYRWYVVIDKIVCIMSSAEHQNVEKLEREKIALKNQIIVKWEENIRQIGDSFEALKYWQKFFETVDIGDKDKKLGEIVRCILTENFAHGYLSIFRNKKLKKMSLTFLGNFFESISHLPNQNSKLAQIKNMIVEALEDIDLEDDNESALMLDIIYYYNSSKLVTLKDAYSLLGKIKIKIKDFESKKSSGFYKDKQSYFIQQQEKYNLLYLEILTLIVNLEDKNNPDFDEKKFAKFMDYLKSVSIDSAYFIFAAAVFKYAYKRKKVDILEETLGLRESTFSKKTDIAKFNLEINRARFEAILELAQEDNFCFSQETLHYISMGHEDMRLSILAKIAMKIKEKREFLALILQIKNRIKKIITQYNENHENTHSYLVALEATMILKKAGIQF